MNVGLLDARGTGSIFNSLRQKFTPVEFFDLCSVIEEFVLREKVVIVGKYKSLPDLSEMNLSLLSGPVS